MFSELRMLPHWRLDARWNQYTKPCSVSGKQLQRWLQILVYTEQGNDRRTTPLLLLAVTRGRIMEQAAEHLWPTRRQDAERAFLVGMLSLTPALFGMPIGDIVRTLPLPRDIEAAVLKHEGALGTLLAQVSAFESSSRDSLPTGIPARVFNQIITDAMSWANSIA